MHEQHLENYDIIVENLQKIHDILCKIEDPMTRLHVVNSTFINEILRCYGDDYINKNAQTIGQLLTMQLMRACEGDGDVRMKFN